MRFDHFEKRRKDKLSIVLSQVNDMAFKHHVLKDATAQGWATASKENPNGTKEPVMVPPVPQEYVKNGKVAFFYARLGRNHSVQQTKHLQTAPPDLFATKENHIVALGSTLLSTAAERDKANLEKLMKIKENIEGNAMKEV